MYMLSFFKKPPSLRTIYLGMYFIFVMSQRFVKRFHKMAAMLSCHGAKAVYTDGASTSREQRQRRRLVLQEEEQVEVQEEEQEEEQEQEGEDEEYNEDEEEVLGMSQMDDAPQPSQPTQRTPRGKRGRKK